MYTVYRIVKKDIPGLKYNQIDLGLPSGRLWADKNVGATNLEDYGYYFQWGDTVGYTCDGKGEITAVQLAEFLNTLLESELGMEITADNVGEILEMMEITGLIYQTRWGCIFQSIILFNWESYFDTDKESGYDEDGYLFRLINITMKEV